MYATQQSTRSFHDHLGLARDREEQAHDVGLLPTAPLQAPPDYTTQHASHDHVRLGGDHLVELGKADPSGNRAQITTGHINALADYVASLEELEKLDADTLTRACELMEKEALSLEEEAWLNHVFPNYHQLSFDNDAHFGPSDPALCDPAEGNEEPTNRSVSGSGLEAAFALAAEAGRKQDAAGLDRALAEAAFAGHFLADAFSAGHLFNKADVMAQVDAGLAQSGYLEQESLITAAASRIHEAAAADLAGWRVLVGGAGGVYAPVSANVLALLIGGVRVARPDIFANGVVYAVHEALGEQGVRVTDGVDTWQMFGDDHLDPESQARCSALLDDVYAQVYAAFNDPDCTPSVGAILDRLPVPVEDEQARIRSIIERATTVEGGGMEDALVEGSLGQLDTILASAGDEIPGVRFVRVGAPDAGGGAHHHGHEEAPLAPGGGDVSALGFEEIGESSDEWAVGGTIDRGRPVTYDPAEGHPEGLFGEIALDDLSVKSRLALASFERDSVGVDLMNLRSQAGLWWDEQGDLGLGFLAELGGANVTWGGGEVGGEDPYWQLGLDVLGLASRAYLGTDGYSAGLQATAFEVSIATGTGWSADSAVDWGVDVSTGVGVGIDNGMDRTDRDGDGVSELRLEGDLDIGAGIHLGVESEALGWLADRSADAFGWLDPRNHVG